MPEPRTPDEPSTETMDEAAEPVEVGAQTDLQRAGQRTDTALDPRAHEVAPRTLLRSRTDRVFGGICGGVGESLGVDPSLVRALFALSSLVGGAGALAYLLGLFMIPLEEGAGEPEEPKVDLQIWAGLLFVVIGGLVASSIDVLSFGLIGLSPGSFWPAVVAVVASFIVARKGASDELSEQGLRRPRSDRVVSGLLSGFARYTNIDTNLVRIGFAVMTYLSYGLGILLYLVLSAFIPEDDEYV